MNYFRRIKNKKGQAGITLIEILVTASLIVYISTLIIQNFSIGLNLDRIANSMVSDIRLAQQLALSAHQFQGPGDPEPRNRCGYGIYSLPTYMLPLGLDFTRSYGVYAGEPTLTAEGLPNPCGLERYGGYDANKPFYRTVTLDSRVEFGFTGVGGWGVFSDIFFKPPGPTTYIDGLSVPVGNPWGRIIIKRTGVPDSDCEEGSPKCIFICVYYSGRVEVSKNANCPAVF